MRILLLFVFLFNIQFTMTSQIFDWALNTGSKSATGNGVVVDSLGNTYMIGSFSSTINYSINNELDSLVCHGLSDVFIQKTTPSGSLLWVKGFGGEGNDRGQSITIDNEGFLYITGGFTGNIDFDMGEGSFFQNSNGYYNTFVEKLDTDGNLIWVQTYGNSTTTRAGEAIKINNSGDVLITGIYAGTIDFNNGIGVDSITSCSIYGGIFLLCLDSDGSFNWVENTGGSDIHSSENFIVDNDDNIILTGKYWGGCDLDPGEDTLYLTANLNGGVFVQKLNMYGELLWAKSFDGSNSAWGTSIDVDSQNNIYVTGGFQGQFDFDPGVDTAYITASTMNQFLVKLDEAGNYIWSKKMGSSDITASYAVASANSLVIDAHDNVYTTGFFMHNIFYDNAVDPILTSNGDRDFFITKIDTLGNLHWARGIGGNLWEDSFSVYIDELGNIYVTGNFFEEVNFSTNPTPYNLIASFYGEEYARDAFLLKLNDCPNATTDIESIIACNSYTWIDGNTYLSDTTATVYLQNIEGCDSIIQLNLTITNPIIFDEITTCDSLEWIDGEVYYEDNNNAAMNFPSAAGCDSIVNLDLTILHSSSATDIFSACDSLTWIDGNTYYSDNNSANYVLVNSVGCDSIITLDLNIVNSEIFSSVVSFIDENTLTVNYSNAEYLWVNCDDNNSIIENENNQTFTPTSDGIYACIVSVGPCPILSNCLLFSSVDVQEKDNNFFSISFNPISEEITLLSRDRIKKIELYNALGQKLNQVFDQNVINVSGFSRGVYLVKIFFENTFVIEKIQKF